MTLEKKTIRLLLEMLCIGGLGAHLLSGANPIVAGKPVTAAAPTGIAECPMFPPQAIFNTRISDTKSFPADPRSEDWIRRIGAHVKFHADWGRSENQDQHNNYYGIPHNVVATPPDIKNWPIVTYEITDPRESVKSPGWPAESDCPIAQAGTIAIKRNCESLPPQERRFPFPADDVVKAEHGRCNDVSQCGDRHVLVVEKGACRLWEAYFAYKVRGTWQAQSTSAWDLRSTEMRPEGWTSGDAAGLPILPLLARAQEADTGEIRHALRVTFRDGVLDRKNVWPARHSAGNRVSNGIPFGAPMRLKGSFEIPGNWSSQSQALARAMKYYGLYVADIGSDMYVQGDPSQQWNESTIRELQTLKAADFEFFDISSITSNPKFNPNSYSATWP